MKTNLLNDLSNVVKKGAGLACSWSQVGRMSGEGAIEHPLSTHSAPFGTRWKPAGNKSSISMHSFTRLAAMVTLLLTLACGNVWGAGNLKQNTCIYFDNSVSNWDYTYVYFNCNDEKAWKMGAIANTKLYLYNRTDGDWNSYPYVRLFADKDDWGDGNVDVKGWSNLSTWANNATNTYNNYTFDAYELYYIKPDKAGSFSDLANLSVGHIGNGYTYLNKTMTLKTKVSTDCGSTYSDHNAVGALSASSYKFSNYYTCGTTSNGSLSVGSASATFDAGYRAATTLTAARNVSGYYFAGWYDADGNLISGNATTTVYPPNSATTYYAYYTTCPDNITTAGTAYKFQFKSDLTNGNISETGTVTLDESKYLAAPAEGGNVSVYCKQSGRVVVVDNKGLKTTNNDAYFTLNLECPILEGDIIKYIITSQNGGLYKANTKSDGNLIVSLPKCTNNATYNTYSVPNGSALIGKSTLYMFGTSTNAQFYYFEIIRKLRITLDENGGATLPDIYGNTGDKVVLPHAFKTDNRFKGWFTSTSGGTQRANYYTISSGETVHAQWEPIPASGDLFTLTMESSMAPASDVTIPAKDTIDLLKYATVYGGAAVLKNTASSAKGKIASSTSKVTFNGGNDQSLHIHLDFPILAGDTIITNIESQDLYYTNSSSSSARSSSNSFTKGSNKKLVVGAGSVLENRSEFWIWQASTSGGKLSSLKIKRPAKYTISYAAGSATGASGSLASGTKIDGANFTLSDNSTAFTRSGYTYDGWSTNTDGSTKDYNLGGTYTANANITLYPHWVDATPTHTVTASTSTGTTTYGTVSSAAASVAEGSTTTITAVPATGYRVTNWAVEGTGASISPSGASNSTTTTLTMGTANATVTVTFGPKPYTVTLNNQSATTAGTTGVSTTYAANTNMTSAIDCPAKTGKVFAGYFTGTNGTGVQLIDLSGNWIASAGGSSTYLDGSKNWKYDGNLTLYACWMEYASTLDFKTEAAKGTPTAISTFLESGNMVISSTENVSWDNDGTGYEGLKIKKSGRKLLLLVESGKKMSITLGKDNNAKISKNGGAEADLTKEATTNFGPMDADSLFVIRTTSDGAVSVQKILIEDPCSAPTIGSGPSNVSICPGSTTTLTVGSITGGNTPYTYQWYDASNDAAMSTGSGYATASFTTPTLNAAASYYCIVTENGGCTTQSSTAAVSMKTTTAITSQPSSVANANVKSSTSLSVTATGTNLGYQWYTCDDNQKTNADDLDGETSATLSITPAAAGVTYYYCVVTGDCGTETSNVVSITAKNAINPTLSYASTSIAVGTTTAVPTVGGNTGSGTVTYTSSNTDVATVASDGKVTAKAVGSATITATIAATSSYWGNTATANFTVGKGTITPSLSYSSTTLTTGDNSSSPTVTGNSGSGSVSYAVTSSSPSGCITVNGSTGVVTAVAAGTGTVTATIAATDNYLGGTATADFTVNAPCFYADDLKKKDGGGDIANNAYITASLLASGTITGGTLQNTSGGTLGHSKAEGIVLNGNSDEVTLAITGSHKLGAGSVITLKGISNSSTNAVGFTVGGQAMSEGNFTPASATKTAFTRTYTVAAESALDGVTSFKIKRSTSEKVYLNSIKITGCEDITGYTISFEGNGNTGGSMSDVTPITEGDDVTLEENGFTKNGYTFANWTADVGVTINSATVDAGDPIADQATIENVSSDITLTAVWTPNTYGITYHLNGASWASAYDAPATYTVGTGATLPVAGNMTNTGYSFNGWKNNSGLTGDNITAIGTSDYGNKEFWAKWTENTYDVTYNANGGTGTTAAQNGHYITLRDNGFTAPSGKTFVEWNTANDGSGDSYNPGEEVELTANLALYAIWSKSVGTINWTVTKIDSKLYRGGGGYSIKAEINDVAWDATDADSSKLELTATDGVVLRNIVKSINGSGKAQITANFDITTDVNANATKITFTLSVPENNGYAPKSDDHDESLTNCTGGKVEVRFTSSNKNDEGDDFDDLTSGDTQMIGSGIAKMIATGDCKISATTNKDGYRSDRCAIVFKFTGTTTLDIYYSAGSSSRSFALYSFSSGKDLEEVETSDYSTKSAVVPVTGAKASFAHTSVTSSNPSISSGVVATSGSGGGIKATYSSLSSGYYVLLAVSGEGYFYGFDADGGGGGGGAVTPTLTWDDGDLDIASDGVAKETGDADFTFTASTTSNTLGAITYASSNTSVVTVNATTGKVHVVGAGSATITATLAESGCYEEATATYNITVTDNCDDVAGTIETEDRGCDGIQMTVTGHTGEGAGATYQWYKDGVSLGSASGAQTATYTATEAGEYYVIVTNTGSGHCSKASTNSVTLEAQETATATKIVDEWYVKNGRRTPDIALVQTENADNFTVKSGSTVIWDTKTSVVTGFAGCSFYLGEDGIIYLKGQKDDETEPSGLIAGDETLTFIAKSCGGDASGLNITIHKQAATTYKEVAFVVDGTKKGAWNAVTSGHADGSMLYEYLDSVGTAASARKFKLYERNIYKTTNEDTLRQHYSQFDAILITDDPSTQTVPSKGDDYTKKGYVNAIGSLIDIRPILTMEAYVSALENWKAKGINGNPSSPNPRQYAMKLDCKNHAIFTGINSSSSNVEVETIDGVEYWTVAMVDSTKSPYDKHAYNDSTSQYPALQGFEASDVSDLMLLGEISEGTLYAGVERQEEPAARLLLLGLNNKALPNALTPEGKKIIENALSYLIETDMEKVDDCSNYFTDETGDHQWSTAANWSKDIVPNSPYVKARILKPCVLSGLTTQVARVDIATSGKSLNLDGGECSGSLTIEPTGALIVGGEVRSAVAPYFNTGDLMPTTEEDLVINTDKDHQAALVFNNDKGDTKATVNLYSLGRKEGGNYQYQYFAVPMNYIDVNPAFAGSGIYTYVWKEATGWERRGYYTGLEAFEGLGITTKFAAQSFELKGALTSTKEKTITLTAETNGQNIVGNSWLAPIDIASLQSALDGDDNIVQKTIYIYCSGRDASKGTGASGTTETPGQWLAIPIKAADWGAWEKLSVIPAMQAFCIITSSETTMTLNYNDHVRTTASESLTEKLRAPKRRAEDIDLIRIRVADSQTHTDLYLFEGEQFSEEFDNGWEAKYLSSDGRSAKLYAETANGPMAVVAQPEYEGTVLGFAPGKETEYTFTFSGPNKDYYLNDLKEKKSTLISEDESYMFTFEEGDTNRFYISKTPINAPSVATGTENTGDGTKARKVLVNDKLYIILNGRVYSAEGVMVK